MPLNGKYARNKGMSLFPCKIGGRFAMLSRREKRLQTGRAY